MDLYSALSYENEKLFIQVVKLKKLLQEAQLPQRNSASATHMEGGGG